MRDREEQRRRRVWTAMRARLRGPARAGTAARPRRSPAPAAPGGTRARDSGSAACRLRSSCPACMFSEVSRIRLEKREEAEGRRGAEHPRPGGVHTLRMRAVSSRREKPVKGAFFGPSRLLFVTGFRQFSPGRPPAPSASHRPAELPPVKAATASVSRAWRAGALQARWSTAAVEQPLLAEFLVRRVARLGQAVGEEHQPIARADRDARLFVLGLGKHAEHGPADRRAARPSRRRARASAGSGRRWCR